MLVAQPTGSSRGRARGFSSAVAFPLHDGSRDGSAPDPNRKLQDSRTTGSASDRNFDPIRLPFAGLVLDTETTGVDHRKHEIIEIGAVAFTFNQAGEIGDITGVYGGLQQPTAPIPPEITALTGINDEMVDGQVIDMSALRGLIAPADLIIAHNAGFDRPFCEAFSPAFAGKAWACSHVEIDWSARGFEGTKLGYLIGQAGYFHNGHRAVDDCFALLEVLDRRTE